MDKQIDWIKRNWLYLLEIIILSYIFMQIPKVNDRWMEGVIVSKYADPIRYIWYQVKFSMVANGRIVSNLLGAVMQKNFYLCAIFNAVMIVLACYYMVELVKNNNSKTFTILLAFFMMLAVSDATYQEVYYYAGTLYIGAMLISVMLIYYYHKKNRLGVLVSILLGALWAEHLAISLVVVTFIWCISAWIREKQIPEREILYFLISLLGFLFMYLCITHARTDVSVTKPIIPKEILGNIMRRWEQNSIVVFVWSIILFVFFTQKMKDKKIIRFFVVCIYGLFAFIATCVFFNEIYSILATRFPYDSYAIITLYEPLDNAFLAELFKKGMFFVRNNAEVWIICACVGIFAAILTSNNKMLLLEVAMMMLAASFIDLSGIQTGARIASLGLFLLICFGMLIWAEVKIDSMKIKRIIIAALMIPIFLRVSRELIFAESAHEIEKNRLQIIEQVRFKQLMNEWNYDEVVHLPAFTRNIDGRTLWGGNPKINSPHYIVFLEHYKLGRRTIVVFKDDSAKIFKKMDNR